MRVLGTALGLFIFALPLSAQAEKLTVASWNFGFLAEEDGRGCYPRVANDYDRLRDYVRRIDADIIAFQEVESEAAAERVFDPAVYDISITKGGTDDFEATPCWGQPDQNLVPQRVGFAVRKGLNERGFTLGDPDEISEFIVPSTDGLKTRPALELPLEYEGTDFRLLSVHLKSGCATDFLPNKKKACGPLWAQGEVLEDWVDGHTREGIRTIILGDFNRQLTKNGDKFWSNLDDSDPRGSDLEVVAKNERAFCGPYEQFIDHIVVDKGADLFVDEQSFRTLRFDEPWHRAPADHCPIIVAFDMDTALSSGIRWMWNSAEFQALAEQTYRAATAKLRQVIESRPDDAKPWVVVLDADETTLMNLDFEKNSQLKFLDFDIERFRKWVASKEATLMPGVEDFIRTVIDLDGRVVVITNRPADLNRETRENLTLQGLDLDPAKLCVLGRADVDRKKHNPDEWAKHGYKNDKDRRRRLVREGAATDCWSEEYLSGGEDWAKPHDIVLAVGDNVQDYDEITQDSAKDDPALRQALGETFFLLPNPLYGSWD